MSYWPLGHTSDKAAELAKKELAEKEKRKILPGNPKTLSGTVATGKSSVQELLDGKKK